MADNQDAANPAPESAQEHVQVLRESPLYAPRRRLTDSEGRFDPFHAYDKKKPSPDNF